ncbi:MAG: hypothetical protein KAT49_02300 [Methanomicrobia archaeon]|nr:hypothetical protein [Methanomicrobia archaeon]
MNWGNIGIKEDGSLVTDITKPAVHEDFSWRALIALFYFAEKSNLFKETNTKIKYILEVQ